MSFNMPGSFQKGVASDKRSFGPVKNLASSGGDWYAKDTMENNVIPFKKFKTQEDFLSAQDDSVLNVEDDVKKNVIFDNVISFSSGQPVDLKTLKEDNMTDDFKTLQEIEADEYLGNEDENSKFTLLNLSERVDIVNFGTLIAEANARFFDDVKDDNLQKVG